MERGVTFPPQIPPTPLILRTEVKSGGECRESFSDKALYQREYSRLFENHFDF